MFAFLHMAYKERSGEVGACGHLTRAPALLFVRERCYSIPASSFLMSTVVIPRKGMGEREIGSKIDIDKKARFS